VDGSSGVWPGAMPVSGRSGLTSGRATRVQRSGAEQGATTAAVFDAEADDHSLVRAALAGRREAFDVLVTRHRRVVYQVCYRFAGSHEDAADASQDVFLRAYRGLASFKGDAAFSTWLYRIAVNACLNRAAVKRPETEELVAERHVDTRTPAPDARMLSDERARRVRSAINRLPRKQRATVILRVYHDLPHEQISRILGSSVGAVKANFFHALRNLKRLLGEED